MEKKVKVGWCWNDGHNTRIVKVGWCGNDGHNSNKGCGGGSEGWNICGEHSLVYLI